MLLWLVSAAVAADFDAMFAADGWAAAATSSAEETGEIVLSTKVIDGNTCLRGEATVTASIDKLAEVVADVPAAAEFSSEKLIASRVLGRDGDRVEYYQHLDVPNWTMVANRFWVLQGTASVDGETRSYRWDRFEWREKYADLAAELARDHASAVEPNPNFGGWVFTPEGSAVKATYYLCSNAGVSLPEWVQRAAATRTLPGTMADVVREAQRRSAE